MQIFNFAIQFKFIFKTLILQNSKTIQSKMSIFINTGNINIDKL